MGSNALPDLRWGIIGCGLISSWFVTDLVTPRKSPPTRHIIQAIGSSSLEKCKAFAAANCPTERPKTYATYDEVYKDDDVDIVYIGTPHACHLDNALAAIHAGKHVLCEKPLTINAKETENLIEAAKAKGVFLMEGVWTRFFPIVKHLQSLLHEEKIIGSINRAFVDFGLHMPLSKQRPESRTADPSLGAGVLLDMGIYTLTWASLIFDSHPDHITADAPAPVVASSMTIKNGVDETTSVILTYPHLRAQAICTSTMCTDRRGVEFCRIEGDLGSISVGGMAPSAPRYLMLRLNGQEEKGIDFLPESTQKGFYWEADAIAEDLRNGQTESKIFPLESSLRMMRLMDSIRKSNGLIYPQDSIM